MQLTFSCEKLDVAQYLFAVLVRGFEGFLKTVCLTWMRWL